MGNFIAGMIVAFALAYLLVMPLLQTVANLETAVNTCQRNEQNRGY